MRYLVACGLAMIFAGATPCKAHAQIEGPLTAVIAGVALDKFADRLEGIVGQATKSGDFLLEKNARLLHGLVADARVQLEGVLDKKVGELRVQQQNFLAELKTIVDELGDTPKRLLELQDFLVLDLEHIAGRLPRIGEVKIDLGLGQEKPERLSFRRLDGYSQVYQKDGVYSFRLIGAAFGPDFRSAVTVNGKKVKLLDMRTPRKYVLEFDVPVQVLNEKFSDGKVERVDIQVESFTDGKDKPVFAYKNQILLLPKSPVAVKVTERYKAKDWSKELFDSAEAQVAAPKTGENKKHTFHPVSARIPADCLMDKGTIEKRVTGPQFWCEWGNPTYSEDDKVVTLTFDNWLHDVDRTVFLKVKYRKPVTTTKDREVAVGSKSLIPFGSTIVNFSPEYESFTLEAKWFNGREATLTPTQLSRPGIKVSLETSSPPRLLVDLAWPEFGSKP